MFPPAPEALRFACPVCRARGGADVPVRLAAAWAVEGDEVLHGVLHCGDAACRMEYPVIDGIPVLLPDLRAWVAANAATALERNDLPAALESLLGDAAGPGSGLDVARQQASHYGHGHWGDRVAGAADAGDSAAGAASRIAREALALAGSFPEGPVLDVGCAAGRATVEWSLATRRPAVGVDRNLAFLRMARAAARGRPVRFPFRRVGLVFDRVEAAPPPAAPAEPVEFAVADAAALPFAAGTFGAAVSLQVLDCVPSPREHLADVARVLVPGGAAVFATPYDWSPAATPVETWLGGHSQRGPGAGRAEPVLRALLTPGAHPAAVAGLVLAAERERVPWEVRLHDRSRVAYEVHMVAARRGDGAAASRG